jgi:hypothetical protein
LSSPPKTFSKKGFGSHGLPKAFYTEPNKEFWGYGSLLLETCWQDAQRENKHGVAVVTRKGTWMASKGVFIKNGYELADKAPPDFELLVRKIDKNAPSPTFKGDWEKRLNQYGSGLVIITSDQCPYTAKAVKEISETAVENYLLKPTIIELEESRDAQNNSPCAFGTFCLLFKGKVIAEHPISNTRFKNIMAKELK